MSRRDGSSYRAHSGHGLSNAHRGCTGNLYRVKVPVEASWDMTTGYDGGPQCAPIPHSHPDIPGLPCAFEGHRGASFRASMGAGAKSL